MNIAIRTALAATLVLAVSPAAPGLAETVTCPPLASVSRVGNCPTPEELKLGFTGYCSDNQRMYDKDETCVAFDRYRAMKDVALWESADGSFQGYLPCGGDEQALKSLMPERVAVATQGSITKVMCTYPGDLVLTRRGKGACKVEDKLSATCE